MRDGPLMRNALTGPIETSRDGVQEGVLRRDQTPHHRHPRAGRAASLASLRSMALGGHEARQEPGRGPRRSSQPLEEGAEPRHPGLHGPKLGSDHRAGDHGWGGERTRWRGEDGGMEGPRRGWSHLRTGVLQCNAMPLSSSPSLDTPLFLSCTNAFLSLSLSLFRFPFFSVSSASISLNFYQSRFTS